MDCVRLYPAEVITDQYQRKQRDRDGDSNRQGLRHLLRTIRSRGHRKQGMPQAAYDGDEQNDNQDLHTTSGLLAAPSGATATAGGRAARSSRRMVAITDASAANMTPTMANMTITRPPASLTHSYRPAATPIGVVTINIGFAIFMG